MFGIFKRIACGETTVGDAHLVFWLMFIIGVVGVAIGAFIGG